MLDIADECTNKDISITQRRDGSPGIPRFNVQIVNTCVSDCAPADIHVYCGWFASSPPPNPNTFQRLSYNDCLVNGGRPLGHGAIIQFQYANSFMYPIRFRSARFCRWWPCANVADTTLLVRCGTRTAWWGAELTHLPGLNQYYYQFYYGLNATLSPIVCGFCSGGNIQTDQTTRLPGSQNAGTWILRSGPSAITAVQTFRLMIRHWWRWWLKETVKDLARYVIVMSNWAIVSTHIELRHHVLHSIHSRNRISYSLS